MTTPAPYTALSNAIKNQLDGYLGNLAPAPRVEVERPWVPDEAWCGVYLVSRTAPADQQALVAGLKTRFLLRFEIWSWRFSMDLAEAFRLRDELLGLVEVGLMTDPYLGQTCNCSWLEGGEMLRAQDPQKLGRFFAGASTVLIADVVADAHS